MRRSETKSDLPDDREGKPAVLRHQSPDGSLVWVYHVPFRGPSVPHKVLIVRLDADGEVFLSL